MRRFTPDNTKALIYGFITIGAFVVGGVAYRTGGLSLFGWGIVHVVALLTFALHRYHLEEP